MNIKKYISFFCLTFISFFMLHFYGLPKNIQPVKKFQVEKYLGTWYEIARIDNSIEKGLQKVYATYSQKPNGKFEFVTKGFSAKEQKWKTIQSKAKFAKSQQEGYFKVYFLGPFYTSYAIFELGKNYEYAFVSGYNLSYLWLLSRTKKVDKALIDRFIKRSKDLGFKTENILFVNQ